MKRFCAVALSLFLMLGIAACGDKTTPASISGELTAADDINYGFKQTTATDDYG